MPCSRPAVALVLSLLTSGCVQTTTLALAPPPPIGPVRVARAVRAWSFVENEMQRGTVVLFRDTQDESFYSVRNEFQQELGIIDGQGIAYRYEPHREDATRVGTGTVTEGARLILTAEAGTLEQIDLSTIRDASRCSGDWNADLLTGEEPGVDSTH